MPIKDPEKRRLANAERMRRRRAEGAAWIDPEKEAARKKRWYDAGGKEKIVACNRARRQRANEQALSDFTNRLTKGAASSAGRLPDTEDRGGAGLFSKEVSPRAKEVARLSKEVSPQTKGAARLSKGISSRDKGSPRAGKDTAKIAKGAARVAEEITPVAKGASRLAKEITPVAKKAARLTKETAPVNKGAASLKKRASKPS